MAIVEATESTAATHHRRSASVIVVDEPAPFRSVVIRGAAAELATLGFYRFWLATAIRRMLWSATSIENEVFAYHGTGRELFLGFLLAIGILAPFYLLYFLAGIEAERTRAFSSLPLGLAFVAFRQFAIYRARRYRLHRTSWRGLRFGMSGSGWKFAGIALLRGFLTGLTLGAAHPWSQAALERYKMNHTSFGELQGRFEGTGRTLFARGWWLWAMLFLISCLFLILAATGTKPGRWISVTPFALLIVAPFWYATYKAIEWKWWLEGLRFGDVSVSSTLSRGKLIGTYWSFIGVMMLFVIAGGLVGTAATLLLQAAGLTLPKTPGAGIPIAFVAAWATTYLVTLLGFGIAYRLFLIRRVWLIVCASATIHHLEQADDVAARPGTATALGEGFADSLDIFGF